MSVVNGREVTVTYRTEFTQSQRQTHVTINGRTMRRRQHDSRIACGCCAVDGQYHHIGCSAEVCPSCDGILNDCGCLNGD